MAETVIVARLPIGLEGYNGSSNTSQMNEGELSNARNISYDQNMIQKEGGALKLNASQLEAGAGIIEGTYWEPTTSAAYDVVYVGGKLLRDTAGDGTFSTTLKTGLDTGVDYAQFIHGGMEVGTNNKKLFFLNGVDAVEYVDGTGTSMTAATAEAADWSANKPLTGDIHEDRMWMAGNANDTSRVYYSIADDQSDFTSGDSGSIAVFPGDGGDIRRVVSFKGFLAVFKTKGIYYIDTRDSIKANWKVGRVSRNIGTLSPNAVEIVDDDILFIDHIGMLRALSTLVEFGSIGTRNIFDQHGMNDWVEREVNVIYLQRARLHYFPPKREIHCAYPIKSNSGVVVNSTRLILNFSEGRERFRFVDRDQCKSMWTRSPSKVDEMAFGNNDGFVYRLYQDLRTKDGGYTCRFQIAPTDFASQDPSYGTSNKHGHYLELAFEPHSEGQLNVEIIWDNVAYETVSFQLEATGVPLGTFVLGIDKLATEGNLKSYRKRIVGQGRRFSIAGLHSDDQTNFKLADAFLGFKLADHRLQHGG